MSSKGQSERVAGAAQEPGVVPIVMAFDQAFLVPAAVAVTSILQNGSPSTSYRFAFLVEACNPHLGADLFARIAQRFGNFSFEHRVVDISDYLDSRLSYGCPSPLSFARLLIADLMPELDMCLYLDGDILVLSDVAELFALAQKDMGDCYFMAAPDLPLHNTDHAQDIGLAQLLGRSTIDGYVNAGVMALNLGKIRRDELVRRFAKHADRNYPFGDQDILNAVCHPAIGLLPVTWNLAPFTVRSEHFTRNGCSEQDRRDVLGGAVDIVHFIGPGKPWVCIDDRWGLLWNQYAEQLPRTSETDALLTAMPELVARAIPANRMDDLRNARSYMLYGFFWASRELLDRCLDSGMRAPVCFCDASPKKRGSVYRGVECLSVDEALARMDADTMVVVCPQKPWLEVFHMLVDSGVEPERIVRYRQHDGRVVAC